MRYKDGTELARQDWLEECTDFCIFYINKTLIPIFCPFRTTQRLMCVPPMWTLHPPFAFLFDGEDWGEIIPPQACAGHPVPAPAHRLGEKQPWAQAWGSCSSPSRDSAMPRK